MSHLSATNASTAVEGYSEKPRRSYDIASLLAETDTMDSCSGRNNRQPRKEEDVTNFPVCDTGKAEQDPVH